MVDLVRAEIVNIADPQNSGRVQLRAAAMGEEWQAWARVLQTNGAANPATYRPRDVVFIAFEGGDPESPIVLGALAATAAQAEEPECAGKAPLALLPETDLTLDDLVLAGETRAGLEEIIAWIRHEPVLRGEWGFGRRLKPGHRVLFLGPSGTGKSMFAQVIAKQLGIRLHRIDLAAVVSKYIGETEKQLDAIFTEAERVGVGLLFDEADALFGKRSEVRDSQDRYANLEARYLLQRIESFAGLVILTCNRKHDIDPAFLRRLDRVIDFPMPDQNERLRIWQRVLEAVPPNRIGALDLVALSREHELSGGTIVKVLRDASLRALDRDTAIGEADVREAIERLPGGQTAGSEG